MNRQRIEKTVTLQTTLANVSTVEIDCRDAAGGQINVPTGSSIDTITVCPQLVAGGEFCPNAETITGTAPFNASLAEYVHGARALKLFANASGPVEIGLEN